MKFIEVKVKITMNLSLGAVLNFKEKEGDNPRFFEILVSPILAQMIAHRQAEFTKDNKPGKSAMIDLIAAYGVKVTEARITGYKKEEFLAEIVSVDKDGNMKIISCGLPDAMIIGASFDAKMLVSESCFKSAIKAAKKMVKKAIEQAMTEIEENKKMIEQEAKTITQFPLPLEPTEKPEKKVSKPNNGII